MLSSRMINEAHIYYIMDFYDGLLYDELCDGL